MRICPVFMRFGTEKSENQNFLMRHQFDIMAKEPAFWYTDIQAILVVAPCREPQAERCISKYVLLSPCGVKRDIVCPDFITQMRALLRPLEGQNGKSAQKMMVEWQTKRALFTIIALLYHTLHKKESTKGK